MMQPSEPLAVLEIMPGDAAVGADAVLEPMAVLRIHPDDGTIGADGSLGDNAR